MKMKIETNCPRETELLKTCQKSNANNEEKKYLGTRKGFFII